MILQHIEYFRLVAETGNMTKAAAMLHISQPSLSIAIAKLEEELGVKLFDRMGNRIYLNPLGNRFLQKTNDIMRELVGTKDEIAELAGIHSRKITILSDYDHLYQPMISEFAEANPDLQIVQLLCLPEKTIELLDNGTADFAITTHDISSEQIRWKPLVKRRLAVLLSEKNALVNHTRFNLSDLQDEMFILYCNLVHAENLSQWFTENFNFTPKIRFITNEFETMVDLVKRNLGISVVTEVEAARICSNAHLHLRYIVLCTEDLMQNIGIAYHKSHFLSDAAKNLKAHIEAQTKKMQNY